MKVLTLRQPHAWAAMNGATTLNVVVPAPVTYRGLLAVQAGVHLAGADAFRQIEELLGPISTPLAESTVVGVVDLHHAHLPVIEHGRPCCEPWGCRPHAANKRRWAHLSIRNPRPLLPPIPTRGKPGLWIPSDDLAQQISSSLAVRR